MPNNSKDSTEVEFISIDRVEHEVPDVGRIRVKPTDDLVVSFLVGHDDQEIMIPISIKDGYFDAARLVPVARHKLHGFAVALAEATKHWSLPDDQAHPDYPKGGGKAV